MKINDVSVFGAFSYASSETAPEKRPQLDVNSVSNTDENLLEPFPSRAASIDNFETVPTRRLDVVILNSYASGGGDHELANKISRIVTEEGGRTSIVPINAENLSIDPHINVALRFNSHDISELIAPIFIVCPVGILTTEKLGEAVDEVCSKFNFKKEKVLLLEEMDLLTSPRQLLEDRKNMLSDKGFIDVQTLKLGFEEGSIGYLPIDEESISNIKARANLETAKLLDSYNIDINTSTTIHLAYTNDETQSLSSQVFISNTLNETRDDLVDFNYVMVCRLYEEKISEHVKLMLNFKSERLGVDNPSLFRNATISYLDPQSGKLKLLYKLKGDGLRKVNVVLTPSLPKNIFLNLMYLAKSGMATGDQSLGEYISLKREFPYYNMQPWKLPLVAAVKNVAESCGEADLTNKIEAMIVGQFPFNGELRYKMLSNSKNSAPMTPELKQAWEVFNEKLSLRRADVHIRQFLSSIANARNKATDESN